MPASQRIGIQVILGQRIRLDPNNVQATFLERCAGAARRIWNVGLDRWQKMYEAGEKPSWRKINAEVNARKNTDLAWLREIPWAAPNNALQDLGNAFSHFFRRVKAGEKPGYPRFKSKKRATPAFAIEGRALTFDGKKVKIPKLGWVRVRQELRFPGKVLSGRFSKKSGHWYLSVQVEVEGSWIYPHACETQAIVGMDLGVKDIAVLSNGTRVPAPRVLRRLEGRLRMLNKQLARRTKGGANWRKTKEKLAKLHERIVNIRKDVTHNLTASIVRQFRFIGVEDLCFKGMARTRLAKSVHDAAMSEVLRQIDYKAQLAGGVVVKAGRWYPSTKTCSSCGFVNKAVVLGIESWVCPACGAVHDRDDNASINLRNLAAAHAATACCPGSSGSVDVDGVKLPVGQESSSYVNQ